MQDVLHNSCPLLHCSPVSSGSVWLIQRVSIYKCTRTGRHLATFTSRPESSLYTLATEPPQVAASAQVFASGPVAPPCSCCLLSHQTLLWHHRLGHPSLPRLRGMHSRVLVSGLPRSLPPLPPSPAQPCLPCVEGRQRAAPHSSFPSTTSPLQTLHMDRFRQDLPVPRLHFDRGGEFSSNLLRDFCRGEGILQSFTLPASMIHAAAPHFVWPFADVTFDESVPFYHLFPYHSAPLLSQLLFLAPCPPPIDPLPPQGPAPSGVSQVDPLPDTLSVEVAVDSGAARCAASGGTASWGAEPAGAEPGGTESEVAGSGPGGAEPEGAESEGAESRGAQLRGTASSGGPSGASPQLSPRPEPLSPQQLRKWFARRTRLRSGAAGAGACAVGGTGAGGTAAPSLGGGGPGGARAAGPGGTRAAGAGCAAGVGAGGTGAGAAGGTRATGPRGARTGGTGAAGAGGAAGIGVGDHGARAGGGTGAAGSGGARTGGTKAAGAGGAAGVGAGDLGAGDTGAGGAGPGDAGAVGAGGGDTGWPRPYFVPLLQQVLGLPSSTDLTPPLLCPPPFELQRPLQPASPLCAPSPYTEQTGGLTQRRELVSHPASPVRAVRTYRRVPCLRPPPVPGTHHMALRPSSVPQRVPLLSPPASSLPDGPDPESDLVLAATPTVPRLLATVVTDTSFDLVADSESDCPPSVEGEYALGTDVFEDTQEDFECFVAAVPHFVFMLIALEGDPDAPDIPTPRSYVVAITGFSQRQGIDFFHTFSPTLKMTTLRVLLHVAAQRDYELHSLDFSTAFLQGSLHKEIWLRRPPGFTGSFPAGTQWSLRRPVYGLRQAPREWHNTLRTTLATLGFAHSTADPSLFLRTDTSLLPFYVLVYVDDLVFATADTEALALVKSELLKRHTCTDLGELRSYLGLQITRDRVLQLFGFRYSSPQSTPLPTGHSLSAPPSDESVEPSGPHRPDHWEVAKRVLRYLCSTSGMGLVLGGRGPVVLTGHADASWVDDLAMQRSSHGYTFSLGSDSASWRSTRSSSVLSSSCEAEIYAGAMAVQELRWLTYLLTDLGERPRSSPVMYLDNKAMIALCQGHRLEHRTKPIALRYFLARDLQQRGQLRLAYLATRANTADIFTKALQSGDHQRFCTVLGLVPILPHLLTV
ncbi:unnamed protein product [Closterium sp. NIES-54]